MNAINLIALLLLGASSGVSAAEERAKPLTAQSLPGVPGRQFSVVEVTFAPGARAAPHRHGSAFLYAYVLEGAVLSQIEGEPIRTYRTGQNWTEQPGAHHLLTENASSRSRARLLVVFVSEEGTPLKTPDPLRR